MLRVDLPLVQPLRCVVYGTSMRFAIDLFSDPSSPLTLSKVALLLMDSLRKSQAAFQY